MSNNVVQEGTSNWFLTHLLDEFPLRPPSFVLSCNQLKLQPKRNEFIYIVNLSPSGNPGSHYVVLLRRKEKARARRHLLYIDPLGEYSHPTDDVPNFLDKYTKEYGDEEKRLSRPVQHPHSIKCAFFCLFYAYLEFGDINHLHLTRFKKDNLEENDCIVMENLSKIFMSC